MIDGVTGIGLDEGDISGFAAALEHILRGDFRIDSTSSEFKIHLQKFTWDSVVEKLLSKIEERRKMDGVS